MLRAMADIGTDAQRQTTGRARMADVAKLAGVSTSTVSRALRQPDTVSAELRRRIDMAVDRLAYLPNLVAGGLASAKSRSVGVIVPSIINSFFSATIEEMADGLRTQGYQLMLGNSRYSEEIEEALVTSFLAWSPAAIVLTGRRHSRGTLRILLNADLPVIEMWECVERPLDTAIGFSNRAVGRAIAEHFIAGGARRLAFIGAALDRDYRSAERGDGFAAAAASAGLPGIARLDWPERASATTGASALAELMRAHPETEAVFLSNDVLALGALFECQRQGWKVPDRLRLCGFGDLDFAVSSVPALTTVRPPRGEIGRRTAELLLDRFAGRQQQDRVIDLGFELIVRESG
ncbi:transcriptional regulator, LacI family [Rhizobiales bacterium GAS191]|nr:transcriptional regulator, LacI family [Rhizobiales bacterium GAS191]